MSSRNASALSAEVSALPGAAEKRRAAAPVETTVPPPKDVGGGAGTQTMAASFARRLPASATRLLLVASASFVLAAEPPGRTQTPARETDFELLFDGKSLAGWEPHVGFSQARKEEPRGKWWVEDGCLVGAPDDQGRGGFLWVNRSFSDFVLKTDVRLEYPIDSGIFLRCGPGGRSHQVMLDFVSTPHIGAIFVPFQGFVHRCPDGVAALRRDDWNRLEIRIEGEPARIRVWLNETLITDFQHTADSTRGAPPSGGIALQAHPPSGPPAPNSPAGTVRFRNLRIKHPAGQHAPGTPRGEPRQ